MENMKVLFVAAEAAGLIKVGGLGDVAGELPPKLMEQGADIRLVIPAHQEIHAASRKVSQFSVTMGAREETCVLKEVMDAPVRTFLMGNDRYFARPSVYGYSDDPERFSFFCMSVYQWLKDSDFKPDIIHINDWHTAPLAMLVRENHEESPFLSDCALVFTIHSLAYQGICGREVFDLYHVPASAFRSDGVEFYGDFNPMKAGIYYSDRFNAVSMTSARDMTTKAFGYGLEGFISVHRQRLSGIVNGIDHDIWNPVTDPALFQNYAIENPSGKRENKKQLQKLLGFKRKKVALFGVVSRLDRVKGTDLLVTAAEIIIKSGGQLVVLGRGDAVCESALKKLEKEHPESIAVHLAFDSELARRIYAASDMFLMPSRYEPCGLGQLIAMRYGAVPVVHRVGGLADTVLDVAANKGTGNGFTYNTDSANAFLRAIGRALRMYGGDREGWQKLIKRAMAYDSSWIKSAQSYMALYTEAAFANRTRQENKSKCDIERGTRNEIQTNEPMRGSQHIKASGSRLSRSQE